MLSRVFSFAFKPRLSLSVTPARFMSYEYDKKVAEHFENPKNIGTLDENDESVGTAFVGAPACGDVMRLQIKVDEDGKIIDAKYKTFGCAAAIASSSLATEKLRGISLDEANNIKNTEIASELKLPPVKLHCSVLAEEAIRDAIADYRRKHEAKAKVKV